MATNHTSMPSSKQPPTDGTVAGTLDISLTEVVKSMLELLQSQKLHIAQLALEKETGISTFHGDEYSSFLRQLVIDGQWDDVLEYLQPIQQSSRINFRRVRYAVLRCKLLEILCLRFELGEHVLPEALITDCLKELKEACENRQQYNELCFLLGQLSHTGRLQDVPEYRTWNPSLARVECFQQLHALVQPVFEEMFGDQYDQQNMPSNQNNNGAPVQLKDSRLFCLLAKGLLYESAERLCVRIASSKHKLSLDDLDFVPFQPSDKTNSVENMSLLCWLLSLPPQSMRGDFREVPTPLVVEKLPKNYRAQLARFWPMIMEPSTLTTNTASDGPTMGQVGEGKIAESASVGNMLRDNRMVQSMISQMNDLRNTIRSRPTQDAMALSCYVQRSMTGSNCLAAFNGSNGDTNSNHNADSRTADTNDGAGGGDDTLISPLDDPKAVQPFAGEQSQKNNSNGTDSLPDRHSKQQRSDNQQHAVRRHDSLTVKSAATHARITKTTQPRGVRPPNTLLNDTDRTVAGDNSAMLLFNDTLLFRINKLNLNDDDAQSGTATANNKQNGHASSRRRPKNAGNRSAFYALNVLTDQCVLRCASFHTADGRFYAVGSNSHLLRICAVPHVTRQELETLARAADGASASSASDMDATVNGKKSRQLGESGTIMPMKSKEPVVVDQMPCLHNGSIYCTAWNRTGSLIATGSNDKSVKVMNVMPAHDEVLGDILTLSKPERVAVHPTTVRSVVFIDDARTNNSLLLSAGASASNSPTTPNGENTNSNVASPFLMLSDVSAAQPIQLFRGHTKTIMSLCRIGTGGQFVSGSEDGTVRLWDVRQTAAQLVLNMAELLPNSNSQPDLTGATNGTSSVDNAQSDGAFRVTSLTSNGRGAMDTNLVFVGSKDGRCACYDIRSTHEPVFVCRLHSSEIRSLSYDPLTKSLLSAGFDGNVMLTSVSRASVGSTLAARGAPIATAVIQTHDVKYVTVEWHPGAYVAASPSAALRHSPSSGFARQASSNNNNVSDQYLRFVTTSTAKECILWIADPQLM